MNDCALHLVDHVLPPIALRQWVLTLPWDLRYRIGYDRALCAKVLNIFIRSIFRWLRLRAKHELGLESVEHAYPGAVTVIQRSDSAVRLNPHFHSLQLDGVYLRNDDGTFGFHALREPTAKDVESIATEIASKVERLVPRKSQDMDPETDSLADLEPVLALCYGAAVRGVDLLSAGKGRPTLRLVHDAAAAPSTPQGAVAMVDGFNLHAQLSRSGIAGAKRRELRAETVNAWSEWCVTWLVHRSLKTVSPVETMANSCTK
jgi:hypothetical protein